MNTPANYCQTIADNLKVDSSQVKNTIELLQTGGTIPFIARYRKEATGSLDEVAIDNIKVQFDKLLELDDRRKVILETLAKNNINDKSVLVRLQAANSLTELEDIYLPYRPKRKTRAKKAKEQGLAPLAKLLYENSRKIDIHPYLAPEKSINSVADALAGARDIIAEDISEDRQSREKLRLLFSTHAVLTSTADPKKLEEGDKYRDYFDWQEVAQKAPGHRLLAIFRGQREKILRVTIKPPKTDCIRLLKKLHLRAGPYVNELEQAIEDSYQRLLGPSLENELSKNLKARADNEAIQVFSDNLRQLLLAPPLGQKRVLAIDPGYRTGAKIVCLGRQGELLEATTVFLFSGDNKRNSGAAAIKRLAEKHRTEAIGIGNGTAGRETEAFVRGLQLSESITITLVNEDGASVYSASEIGREEFPDHDITVRGSVSIGRRLQDPLAELVKIDPKSIGVGQYQHDVNQSELKKALAATVESCVNSVGVELNSASGALLAHVAGLSSTLATNIVQYREQNGPFSSRQELKKVSRLGPKAFEQCAGFLRIHGASNPLDSSGVHPERYSLVKQMAKDNGVTIAELLKVQELRRRINLQQYLREDVGLPTLNDIMTELDKPGRDPRDNFEQFRFDDSIQSLDDLSQDMVLPAVITNLTKFGAFADIGIKENGLIHISQLADRFVKDPAEVVRLGQKVRVRVLEIDRDRGRIALSMKFALKS